MWCRERKPRPIDAGLALGCVTGLACLLSAGLVAAETDAPSLRVLGSAVLSAKAQSRGGEHVVRALLHDEVDRPIAGAELRVRLPPDATGVTLARCDGQRGVPGELTVVTDASGEACVAVTGASPSVSFSFDDARGLYAPAQRSVTLPDSGDGVVDVGFDPPLRTLSLDLPLQHVGVVAAARGAVKAEQAWELVLVLSDGQREQELTRVALDGFGETHRLSLATVSFGQPGPARLIAQLRTLAGQERAVASAAVMRTATAQLGLGDGDEQVEAGKPFKVSVSSALGPVPSGAVEARSEGRSVAAARVVAGQASLTVPVLPAARVGGVLTLEYVGDGPGWLPGTPQQVRLRAPGSSYAGSLLWLLALVLVAVAVVLSWRRPPRPVGPPPEPPLRPRASIEVLEALAESEGYRGFVRDAHDGLPVSLAVLTFLAPGAPRGVLLQCRTSPDGSFHAKAGPFPAGTLLEVAAPLHATLTAPLPRPGVLSLSLVSRRRALLDRLVQWAERHGRPWLQQGAEPTPAALAATAAAEREPEVESWARAIEQLAFGPGAPDAAREQAAGLAEEPKTSRERGID
jgi:hypothetical protein